jgi:small subunit ribosomal protein S17
MSSKPARNVGIPWIRPPAKSCEDPRCPWHGELPVRGRLLRATVVRLRATRMAVLERVYYHYRSKYMRYERRRSRIHAYVPPCIDVKEGDSVIVGEARPLAKSVAFVVLGKSGGAS